MRKLKSLEELEKARLHITKEDTLESPLARSSNIAALARQLERKARQLEASLLIAKWWPEAFEGGVSVRLIIHAIPSHRGKGGRMMYDEKAHLFNGATGEKFSLTADQLKELRGVGPLTQ